MMPIVNEDGVDREMTADEVAALLAAQAVPVRIVPVSASKLGLKRAFGDRWPLVRDAIAADPERQEEWNLCVTVSRTDPLVVAMIDLLQLSDVEVDDVLVRADELTAPPATMPSLHSTSR